MKYNNYDITKMYYSGYTVTAAYSCGGYKVFEEEVIPKITITKISNPSKTYTIACNNSSKLSQAEVDECYSAITGCCVEITVGDCVTHIGSGASDMTMFESNCVQKVNLPNTLQYIGPSSFAECWSLTDINIPSGITRINATTFSNCTSLSAITLPSRITEIGTYAFRNCSGLTSITLDATTPPTLGTSAFTNTNNCPIFVPCSSYNSYNASSSWNSYKNRIFVKESNCIPSGYALKRTYIGSNGNVVSTLKPCSGLTTSGTLTQTDVNTSNDRISNSYYSANTYNVVIGDCVTSIADSTFRTWPKLETVTIYSNVTSIGANAFYGCNKLTSITINATTPPTLGSDAFYNTNNCPIYVPAASVDAYKSASNWSSIASRIQAIT